MYLPLPPLVGRASPAGSFNGTPPAELPAENGIHVWRAAVATPFFTFGFVLLRLYTRARIVRKPFTLVDCACLLSLSLSGVVVVIKIV